MNRGKGVLLAALGAALAFAAGFGWQYVRAERLEDRVAALERDLEFQRLATELGVAAVEAERENYEAARRTASGFFTGLQAAIDSAPPELAGEMSSILARRDAIITDLSRGVPASADTLAALFIRYHLSWEAVRPEAERGGAPPAAAGST
ncbi:MAG TPA: hypothetical protein VF212_14075 [Longimicrobiales bacterium]